MKEIVPKRMRDKAYLKQKSREHYERNKDKVSKERGNGLKLAKPGQVKLLLVTSFGLVAKYVATENMRRL